jgi:outer membrane protein assembly factor BamE (lipoprotein component of BamABCDE complex)
VHQEKQGTGFFGCFIRFNESWAPILSWQLEATGRQPAAPSVDFPHRKLPSCRSRIRQNHDVFHLFRLNPPKPNYIPMKKYIQTTVGSLCFLALLSALLFGCASVGNNFDDSKISLIKKGQTTEGELIQMFGQPEQRTLNSDGLKTLTWNYIESTVKGETFIPYAGAFMGGTRSKNKMLVVSLDVTDVVANFSYSGGGTESRQTTQGVPK